MPNRDVHKMRESYNSSILLETDCNADPFLQFEKWFSEAVEDKIFEPNAMTLATTGNDGQPSARMVLLKAYSHDGFIYYSNYESKKGIQIQDNNKVALCFWWAKHSRQVRIEGIASRTPKEKNEIYFHSRPRESQVAALISDQSKVVDSRETLEQLYREKEKEFSDKEIPLKENWGGFIVTPYLFEFWQGKGNRLHDRIQYSKEESGAWKIERLAP
ncbi:MAG: pyridoxamine 5-phosphate oxidase [Bacteroidota bacterium]|nr:pyridoxamine 5-phosphate oxidase [Bacteroidota bacterium]